MNHLPKDTNAFGAKLKQNSPVPGRFTELAVSNNGDSRPGLSQRESTLMPWDSNYADLESVRVLVADDHPVVLAGLVSFLSRRPNIKIVGQARNGREAVEQFMELQPDVGLLELHMPLMDGVDAAAMILAKVPLARLLIFTIRATEEDVYRAVRAGVLGYMLKDASEEELLKSIYTVASGRNWMPPMLAGKLARRIVERDLTAREIQVLAAITNGKSNKEIGSALNISEATVKVHVTHILEKLKASGRTEAIRLAVQRGLVRMDSSLAA